MNTYSDTIAQINAAPLPAVVRHDLRQTYDRKLWAAEVRTLLKWLSITGVSVTTPRYSMAQAIDIRLPRGIWEGEHEAKHAEIERRERDSGTWLGFGAFCPFCKEREEASRRLESIILAAFPDLDDRSDTMTDYYDFCLMIE